MADDGLIVVRVLFQNIEEGDRLKFVAQSNTSDTGGGARDLRFRPETEFLPLFKKMFSGRKIQRRKSKGVLAQIEVLTGTVVWDEGGKEVSATMEIWPSTNARPNECRIARISSFGLDGLIQNDPQGGKSVFMMFQQQDGTIRLHFTTETSLKMDNWDPTIKKFAADWLTEGTKSAFLDLNSKERYPHC